MSIRYFLVGTLLLLALWVGNSACTSDKLEEGTISVDEGWNITSEYPEMKDWSRSDFKYLFNFLKSKEVGSLDASALQKDIAAVKADDWLRSASEEKQKEVWKSITENNPKLDYVINNHNEIIYSEKGYNEDWYGKEFGSRMDHWYEAGGSRSILQNSNSGISSASEISDADWMSLLDDETYVRNLTIPGSHDAATGYMFIPVVNDWAKTQIRTLGGQFEFGVRFFDLRVNVLLGELSLFHGVIPTFKSLQGGIEDLLFELESHPREGIIAFISYENNDNENERVEVGKGLVEFINNFKTNYSTHFAMFHPNMKLKDIRGKICFLFDDSYLMGKSYFGKDLISLKDNVGAGAILVDSTYSANGHNYSKVIKVIDNGKIVVNGVYRQDKWDYEEEKHSLKTEAMRKCFIEKAGDSTAWAINNASAYCWYDIFFFPTEWSKGITMNYKRNAYYQNDRAAQYLKSGYNAPHGIIVMDFAGADCSWDPLNLNVYGEELCRTCVEHNFFGNVVSKYSYPQRVVGITIP